MDERLFFDNYIAKTKTIFYGAFALWIPARLFPALSAAQTRSPNSQPSLTLSGERFGDIT